jgi:hypothetical protein
MKYQTLRLILFFGLVFSPATAQQADVDRLDEKLRHHLEMKMPGWSYQRIQPIEGSKGVLLQTWKIQNRAVSISVVQEKSAQTAKEAIQRLANDPSTHAQPVPGIGEEAYVWGFQNRQIVFRKGRNLVYVEAGADVENDPDARALSPSQRKAREESEVKRWRGEFSKHVLNVLDQP